MTVFSRVDVDSLLMSDFIADVNCQTPKNTNDRFANFAVLHESLIKAKCGGQDCDRTVTKVILQ